MHFLARAHVFFAANATSSKCTPLTLLLSIPFHLLILLSMKEERDSIVTEYLESFSVPTKAERQQCCGSSRSLFCNECCRLFPSSDLPACIENGSLELPFELRIILHDQRSSATGLHAVALVGDKNRVSLHDIKRETDSPMEFRDNTYVLFPSEDSVPLSSVRNDILTLVVLDCKWTRPAAAQDTVAALPKVHLSCPPSESHFWRSHTAKQGCLSTIEAIYHAAMELDPTNSDLIHLLWLFGKQRAAIQQRGLWKDRKHLPYTEDAKEAMRALRAQKNRVVINDVT